MGALRTLYAHGFASGPASSKGRIVAAHLAAQGRACALLDLRVPDRHRLRLSAMIDVVRSAIGDADRCVAIGSSLGGLMVARAAERDPRIVGVVLLAPAFRIVERWRARVGEAEWSKWERDGAMDFEDFAEPGGTLHVDFGLMRDAAIVDGEGGDEHARWPEVRVPTTILHGVHDDTVDIGLSREFARTRPHVELVELDDDHRLMASTDRINVAIDAMTARIEG